MGQKAFNPTLATSLAALALQSNSRTGEVHRSPQACERKELASEVDVEVRVPKAGGLEFRPEEVKGGNHIHAHHHHVKKFGGVIVNCHYYGIVPSDFGRAITAKVEVVDKIIGERCYTYLDVHKTPDASPAKVMKIMSDSEGFRLAGTEFSIHFADLPAKQ
jgi:hypothetical protein